MRAVMVVGMRGMLADQARAHNRVRRQQQSWSSASSSSSSVVGHDHDLAHESVHGLPSRRMRVLVTDAIVGGAPARMSQPRISFIATWVPSPSVCPSRMIRTA